MTSFLSFNTNRPAWVGEGTGNPYHNLTKAANYVTEWVAGAKHVHNFDVDFLGLWNENPSPPDYVLTLRKVLRGLRLLCVLRVLRALCVHVRVCFELNKSQQRRRRGGGGVDLCVLSSNLRRLCVCACRA